MGAQQQLLAGTPTGIPAGPPTAYVAVTGASSPYINVYGWNDTTGFGAKLSNPASLPTSVGGRSCHFSPDGKALAVSHFDSPYLTVYAFSAAGGIGSKYSNPATLPAGPAWATRFNQQSTAIAVVNQSASPYLTVYPWNSVTGFGTKYADPVPGFTQQTNNMNHIAWSPAGDAIVVGSPNGMAALAHAYRWTSGSGFGTKYSNPSETANVVADVAFSPSGAEIVFMLSSNTPSMSAYQWSGSTGFGTRLSDPVLGFGFGKCIGFHPAGTGIVVGGTGTYLTAYPWSAGAGTKYTAPASQITGQPANIQFSPSGNAVIVGHVTAPYLSAYAWGPGLGTKYSNPNPAHTQDVIAMSVSPAFA